MPAGFPDIGDVGPTRAHSGNALLRHIVEKSPKPMTGCLRARCRLCAAVREAWGIALGSPYSAVQSMEASVVAATVNSRRDNYKDRCNIKKACLLSGAGLVVSSHAPNGS